MSSINLVPTLKQHECWQYLHDTTTKFIGFGGGAGGGKTWLLCEFALINAYLYPGSRGFIARNELKRLMNSTYITWTKVCKHHNIPQEDWSLDGKYNVIKFKNGSTIDLLDISYKPTDPDYERFGSTEYTYGAIEEAGETHFKAFDVLKSRVGRHNFFNNKELPPKMLCTFNPSRGWVYRIFYKPWKNGELSSSYAFVQSLYKDNPHTAKEYGEQLAEIVDKTTRERLMLGNWEFEEEEGLLMHYRNIQDLFTNSIVKTTERYLIVDVARFGDDKIKFNFFEGLESYKRETYGKQSLEVTKQLIIDKANEHKIPYSHILIDEDGVGCLARGTEVFTVDGWKQVEQVAVGTEMYSKSKSGNVCIEKVTGNTKREPTDVIKLTNGYQFSFSHFLPYKTRKEYKFKVGSWDAASSKDRIYLDNSFNWIGSKKPFVLPATTITMPNGGTKVCTPKKTISAEKFNTFLGWFMSEGYLDGKYVGIAQSTKSRHLADIEKAITDCGLKFYKKKYRDEIFYMIGNVNLVEWLKTNSYSSTKHNALNKTIPSFVKMSNRKSIRAFLDAFRDGDGYTHHERNYYVTSSKKMSDELLELIYKSGKYGNKYIKHKKGSLGSIFGRVIKRTADNYCVFEYANKNIGVRPEIAEVYEDNVYNLEVSGDTRLYMVRFSDTKAFWVHNGGLVDMLQGVRGFTAASTPVPTATAVRYQVSMHNDLQGNRIVSNFINLKSQCAYKLAELVEGHKMTIKEGGDQDEIVEEMMVLKRRDADKDGKLKIVTKEEMKESLGRSPDVLDTFIMRMLFVLESESTGKNFSDPTRGIRRGYVRHTKVASKGL